MGIPILHEDDDLLVIVKPPGINTHAATPFAPDGIYDWLRRREPRWAQLAILQRLDKETSGVLVFSKTRQANRSLDEQFSRRRVAKEYLFLTDRRPPTTPWSVRSWIGKRGDDFRSFPSPTPGALEARTRFVTIRPQGPFWLVRAEPETGRTHQIRLHAATRGFPILGDERHGGTRYRRLCLHAAAIRLTHPTTGQELRFESEPDFESEPGVWVRRDWVESPETDAFRVVHGAADGRPGWHLDRLGPYLLASRGEVDSPADDAVPDWVLDAARRFGSKGVYLRHLDRQVRRTAPAGQSPRLVRGEAAPPEFEILENGIRFRTSLVEGYSYGLFLDQRENRRRLRTGWIGPLGSLREGADRELEVLNAFAYTCGFSVAAALGGARTTSLDLSRKYLEWGRRNFCANGLDPTRHEFLSGDAFDWLRRLTRRQRRFDLVLLDPPTFSQSRQRGVFRAERDLPELTSLAAPLVRPGGILFLSTNASRIEPEAFVQDAIAAVKASGRSLNGPPFFVTQPMDFPISRDEPAHLKTVWFRLM